MAVEVDLGQFRQLLPRDAIRPVYQPRFIPGERAGVARSDLVIGVEINGEAKLDSFVKTPRQAGARQG